MKTRKIYRPANVTRQDAIDQIKQAGKELVSIELVGATGVKVAAEDAVGQTGLQWEAAIKVAEFPFSKDEGPKDDAPEEKSEDSPEPKSDDSDDKPSDDEGSDDPFGDDDKPKEPTLSEVMDLVTQIADKLGIVPGGDPMLDAPDDMGPVDPVAPGGPPADLGPAPLPPPVPEHKPGGPGVFSNIVVANTDAIGGRRSFVAIVADAHLLNDGEIVNEARVAFPGYRAAGRIDRVTLADGKEARVPMIAENGQG